MPKKNKGLSVNLGTSQYKSTTTKPVAGLLTAKPGLVAGPAKPSAQGGSTWPTPPGLPKPTLGQSEAPAPPAAPQTPPKGQKPEFDQQYFDRIDRIDRGERSALDDLDASEQRIKFDFGLEDPTNPFSRANAMKLAFLRRARGTSAGLASRGQLYSGAHERGMARVRRDEEEARASLRRSYEDALGDISKRRGQVKFDTEDAKAEAFDAWLRRVPDADVDVPDDVADSTSESQPAPVVTATSAQPTTGAKRKDSGPKASIPMAPAPPADSKKTNKAAANTGSYVSRDKRKKKGRK